MEPDEQATIYTYIILLIILVKLICFMTALKKLNPKKSVCYKYNDFNKIIQITNENDTSELIIDAKCYSNDITNLKKAYICDDDICLFQGYTHALQCLSGSCTFKNDATNTIRDIPFDNFPAGLCRYNAKANSIECDDVYVKLTLFQKGCSYMHCGKLKRGSCVIDDECTYNICTNEKRNLSIICTYSPLN
ncbi:hypothetical protein LY90DRAFT_504769 [Neocallimastix californiae]|uniref:Uncharacterized protein n=1 Tax=Neocallimastix californiae TaxID=1754190 RepID=A0A1Y2E5K5_9FUNG|nr:hypothetical protein LY90DRAFT_504769 [Neocallimastix californiae]|eukprot:ORY66727.1 hypothetical protein LY90DRAFT_504769 [Neocallimastix californiae]